MRAPHPPRLDPAPRSAQHLRPAPTLPSPGTSRLFLIGCSELVATMISRSFSRYAEARDLVATDRLPDTVRQGDVLLLDLCGTRSSNGWETLEEAVESHPDTAVIVMLDDVTQVLEVRARACGARDVLTPGHSDDVIVRTVRSAQVGSTPRYSSLSVEGSQTQILTPRQVDVVTLIAGGMTNEQIAQHLYLSVNTVKSNIRAAYQRMGVDTRSEAVLWALRHGLTAA